MSDSNKFSGNPVLYVADKTAKHGGVFCSKIASWPCVFAASYKSVIECMSNGKEFPTNKSMIELISKCVGTPFILSKNLTAISNWRRAFTDVFYGEKMYNLPVPIKRLKPEWQDIVDRVVEKHLSQWIKSGSLKSLYKSSKDLSQEVLCELFLGMSLEEAKKQGFTEQITNQFRGCESIPVEGIPLVTSSFEAGVSARKKLAALVLQRLESGKAGPLAKHLLKRCESSNIKEVAKQVTFLLHGMVPKALASGLLYTWLDVTHYDQKSLYKDDSFLQCAVLESMRLHPAAGVMGRGVACTKFQGYELGKQHGEWKAWIGITAANLDKAAYGPTARQYCPQRWASEDHIPPPPLTFGHGARSCIGSGIAFSLIHSATAYLTEKDLLPSLQCVRIPPSKTLPVQRPTSDIACKFISIRS